MTRSKGRKLAWWLGAATMLLLGLSAALSWREILARWTLRGLASADVAVRSASVARLGELGSSCAIPGLLAIVETEPELAPEAVLGLVRIGGATKELLPLLRRFDEPSVVRVVELLRAEPLSDSWRDVLFELALQGGQEDFVVVLQLPGRHPRWKSRRIYPWLMRGSVSTTDEKVDALISLLTNGGVNLQGLLVEAFETTDQQRQAEALYLASWAGADSNGLRSAILKRYQWARLAYGEILQRSLATDGEPVPIWSGNSSVTQMAAALIALGSLEPPASPDVTLFTDILGDRNLPPTAQAAAAFAIAKLGPPAREAVPALALAIETHVAGDHSAVAVVVARSVEALARIGVASPEVVRAVGLSHVIANPEATQAVAALNLSTELVRPFILEGLSLIERLPALPDVVATPSVLLEALRQPFVPACRGAARALGWLAQERLRALDEIAAGANTSSTTNIPVPRTRARKQNRTLPANPEDLDVAAAGAALLDASRHSDSILRGLAVEALVATAPQAESTARRVLEALQDPEPRVQIVAFRAVETVARGLGDELRAEFLRAIRLYGKSQRLSAPEDGGPRWANVDAALRAIKAPR